MSIDVSTFDARLTPVNEVFTVNVDVVVVVFVVTLLAPPLASGGREAARGLGMVSILSLSFLRKLWSSSIF